MSWTLVEQTRLNIVKHLRGGLFGPLGPQKRVTGEPQNRQNMPFLSQNWQFFRCFLHPPVALSRGWNAFNISPWMCSVMFNQLWALFNPFRGIGSNQSQIHCFGRFLEPPGLLQGSLGAPKWVPDSKKRWAHQLTTITKTIIIIYKVWLMKNKNCPTSTTLLLLSTLCTGIST